MYMYMHGTTTTEEPLLMERLTFPNVYFHIFTNTSKPSKETEDKMSSCEMPINGGEVMREQEIYLLCPNGIH